ncbi:3-oxoacyl-[acyl-carrier-protein] reductase [Nocardia seriolae]|uniref:3-oxoacyl-[acyl-carrier-protein] reductase n=1 Tax=Nocardia seriolae TaxID=37332 RepID=A0ABC8AUQ1_9NOCA|nr:3-oxoacyl-[acyl-carrier-protein] reductase [Nocardia seriolae]BEK87604.1 hypothetical protein NSERKGN1266_35550 [Nocardia seriolae]GEM26395.1 hypothetical protein NS2_46340 [Nocardia seriolae NBRC 15557]
MPGVTDRVIVVTEAGAAGLIRTAVDAFGTVHGVIHNAGILRDGSFAKMTADNWEAVQRVHLWGGYYVDRAAGGHPHDRGHRAQGDARQAAARVCGRCRRLPHER